MKVHASNRSKKHDRTCSISLLSDSWADVLANRDTTDDEEMNLDVLDIAYMVTVIFSVGKSNGITTPTPFPSECEPLS
jgi:hypothetical protein